VEVDCATNYSITIILVTALRDSTKEVYISEEDGHEFHTPFHCLAIKMEITRLHQGSHVNGPVTQFCKTKTQAAIVLFWLSRTRRGEWKTVERCLSAVVVSKKKKKKRERNPSLSLTQIADSIYEWSKKNFKVVFSIRMVSFPLCKVWPQGYKVTKRMNLTE
jgi:hypothetical protein